MKQYRIGQLAKMMGVSLDFIRFYEQKGLIKASVDPDNNYHYYDVSQSEIIYKILQYRKLGFNVQETIELINHADKERLLEMYASRATAHRNSISMSVYAIRYFEFLQRVLRTKNDTWYIEQAPSIWYLPHTLNDDYLEDTSIQKTFRMWKDKVPLNFTLDKWIIGSGGELKAIYHGRAIECSVAEEFGLKPVEPVEYLPERRVLEYYLDYKLTAEFDLEPSIGLSNIQPALDLIHEKNFVIDGDIFVRLVTFYMENNYRHNIFVIYIPIA